MEPLYDDSFCRMFVGDAIDVLSQLPEKCIHTCVTSPPYFGLRSYLSSEHPDKTREGGTQETPEQYVQWLVDVFRGVWRVLRDDGTCWLNLGDSYAAGGAVASGAASTLSGYTSENTKGRIHNGTATTRKAPSGYKPKDLLMIPARVALALQADGWFLRSQIVWTKPNPMPESVTDRPTQATEMVYLLTKKPRYFYDAESVKETLAAPLHAPGNKKLDASRNDHDRMQQVWGSPSGRNLRNYWQISTRPYPGSHYATFPPELPLRCIKAGTSEHGVCSECRAPWRRVVESVRGFTDGKCNGCGEARNKHVQGGASRLRSQEWHDKPQSTTMLEDGVVPCGSGRTIGFEPTCSHDADTIPATVLDPFSGSGTTGLIARKLGRRSVLIDLDDRNMKLLEQRMGYQSVLF